MMWHSLVAMVHWSADARELLTGTDAVALLMRVHYGFFMSNPYFWYEPALVESDGIICRLASDLTVP
jgi:hypothetical protein